MTSHIARLSKPSNPPVPLGRAVPGTGAPLQLVPECRQQSDVNKSQAEREDVSVPGEGMSHYYHSP